MILDKHLEFSAAQSIAGTASTAIVSTNTIDRAAAGSDLGAGTPLYLYVTVDTTVVGGSGGIKIDYIQSTAENLGSPDILFSVTTAATPAAGTVLINQPVPRNTKRYVGVQYTPLGSNTTSGKVNAHLALTTPTPLL